MQVLQSIWHDLPGLLTDRVELMSLELKRAVVAMVQIVALVAAAAMLTVTAWLVLWAGLVAGAVALGLAWPWALGAAGVINLLAAAMAVSKVRSLLPKVGLPVTKRHLKLGASTSPQPVDTDPRSLERHHLSPASQPAAR